jgi:hypothetical protein
MMRDGQGVDVDVDDDDDDDDSKKYVNRQYFILTI